MSEDEDSLNPPTTSNIIKHIYFDEEPDEITEPSSAQKIIERPTPSTIRVDGSDLITRCKDFLPLLANPIEKLSEEEAKELDIPEILSDKSSKESGEASSTTEDDEEKKNEEIVKKKRKKKKKKKKKKVKTDDNPPVNIEK